MNEKPNEIDYDAIVKQLNPDEVETFLALFPSEIQPHPRIVFEAVIDGLGLSDDYMSKRLGPIEWSMLSRPRSRIKALYTMIDVEEDGCLRSLRPSVQNLYSAYPRLLIHLHERRYCLGLSHDYLDKKANMIEAIWVLSNGSMARKRIRTFTKCLEKLYKKLIPPMEYNSTQVMIAQSIAKERRAPTRCEFFEKIGINCRTRSSIK